MNWETLLTTDRLGGAYILPGGNYPINEFEKDYGNIITSASFRRLQDKTQVFPLDKSDFVRTRLTHSIEVASLAKRLGEMVFKNIQTYLKKSPDKIPEGMETDILDLLMCAGLLHDLGNPPFGHFGEVVIGEWFAKALADEKFQYNGKPVSGQLTEQMAEDLIHFEGNAQTLRILTKLHPTDGSAGMNLTPALLNVLVKYPTDSLHFEGGDPDIKNHKPGYYLSEKAVFDMVTEKTGTCGKNGCCRHPLTYILEAADDIAYATADLEDAHKKGMFTISEFSSFFRKKIDQFRTKMTPDQVDKSETLVDQLEELRKVSKTEQTAFQAWVEYARNWLMYSAAYGFTLQKNYREIMAGSYTHDIMHGTFHEYSMKIMQKEAMKEFVYNNPSIVKLELAAQTILSSLMDRFIPAILCLDEENKQTKGEKKLIGLISDNYLDAYRSGKGADEQYNLYLRLLLVSDYISGMTDSYAKDLYQSLSGIY